MKILIKLSGKVIDEEGSLNKFVSKVKKLKKEGNSILIVHGGGKQISLWMKKLKLEPKFIDGLRYTDKKTLDIVVSILCGLVNKNLVKKFIDFGIKKVVGISCLDGKILISNIYKKLGFVGKNIIKVNKELLDLLLKNDYLVILSSCGLGLGNKNYLILNINADDITYALAEKLKFDNIIFLTDVEGVLDKKNKLIKKINIKEIDKLIASGVVKEGMIPKLKAIEKLLKKKNRQIIITNDLEKEGTAIVKE